MKIKKEKTIVLGFFTVIPMRSKKALNELKKKGAINRISPSTGRIRIKKL
jgi:hypothetical protein